MSHSFTSPALVLRTFDVGEADRYCAVLLRQRGRVMVMASGARRPGARLSGFLLPFRHLELGLRESRSGLYVSSAVPADPEIPELTDLASFTQAQEGIEFLLALVSHEGVDARIFDAALAFLIRCADPLPREAVAFHVRLLHLFGLLPEEATLRSVMALRREEEAFIRAARAGGSQEDPALQLPNPSRIRELCLRVAGDHLTSPLRAAEVAGRIV